MGTPMPRILVTNDDGVFSPGLRSLAEALGRLGEVFVVAPPVEASAIGHALTLRRPLRLEEVGPRTYVVDGTPTDCVNLAVATVLKGAPDLVVSGINKGWNLGDDITYSGTVAGAMEGALLGIASLAVSLQRAEGAWDFTHAAEAAVRLARAVLHYGLPPRTFLNVNVPRGRPKGVRVTVQGRRSHATSVIEKLDPRRQPYFWIEEGENHWETHDRSDYEAVVNGWISVTPLHPDLTNYTALAAVEALSETLPREAE
jgi:5'-nucleotidase